MLKWVLAAGMTSIVMLAAYSALRHRGSVPAMTTLLPPHSAPHAEHRFSAVVVAQPADCDGNLGFFAVFERPSLAAHIDTHHVLIQGTGSDTVALRTRLPRALRHARIELLADSHRALLQALGYRATPLLLLFDRERRLRYAGVVPMTSAERAVQLATITPLVTDMTRSAK